MKALLQGLLLGVALFSLPAPAADQYPDKAQSTRTSVTVNVVWLPDYKTANELCSQFDSAPPKPGVTILACYLPATQTIFAVEPKSFNDLTNLTILGHEFWHALGATHP